MYHIPLVENIVFLENQNAHGQTYIHIIGFLNPNYGIKAINYNKLPSPIMSSPPAPLCITQRSLTFTFIGPNAKVFQVLLQRDIILKF